ncbi:hypothetical protein MJO28_016614 [Puccinia striiformis f. sp. tritici]|uniref:Retrovirus-related Pol polyprotein from transposon TNT 1-94-like beta-barrel domain-containing protein n=3 Tax=Puccinia striiformis TaxID=27350 RepID=A0A0L0V8E3_9BASI|nr:hypothetical protein Pst134EA_033201 [Puccinia striiformis f. sp. tritici]KNE95552.1 hypothetical protein PSTG_11157 [Puccinia striiformis f. sp. tritici PST-78]POW16159.1 hypothetical protein PSTT_01544 [Puccinia striiformis]KAH9440219.1 hypothetical protein Pst134EB_033209 [Puccinia striiformis f. sp. tritici]KAH9446379.1 hypothetical protein Pst134EA_033201 [Puccinia striiformis f. sp. tritici]KAI7934765.1 hypothetical protein MJO29_016028 [Puccinia striiformis f. sp. tritici]
MSENDVPLLDEEVLPVLTNTKFSHWQRQVLAHCMMLGLHNHLRSDLVAAETDIALRPGLSQKKNTTAQILVDYMGSDNHARFISDENRQQPHLIWERLCEHYQSHSLRNQVKVYQELLDMRVTSTLYEFLHELDERIAELRSVGVTIGITENMHVSDELMAGMIVSRLPPEMEFTKELLFNTRPLTIEKVRAHLESKVRDNIGCPTISSSSKREPVRRGAVAYCKNGTHNKNTRHSKAKCRQLHPELAPATREKRQTPKEQESLHEENTVTIGGAIRAIRQEDGDQRNQDPLNHDSIIMTTASPHHMFPNRQHFTQYHQSSITQVKLLNGRSLEVEGVGYVNLENDEGVTHKFRALHVPKLTHPLLSMSRLFSKGCDLTRQGAHQAAIYDSKKNAKIFDVDLSPTNICIVKATLV